MPPSGREKPLTTHENKANLINLLKIYLRKSRGGKEIQNFRNPLARPTLGRLYLQRVFVFHSRHSDCTIYLQDSFKGCARVCDHITPTHPFFPRDSGATLPLTAGTPIMKILTNVTVATCLGLSLALMSSHSTRRIAARAATHEVNPAPPPAFLAAAPAAVTEHPVTASANPPLA